MSGGGKVVRDSEDPDVFRIRLSDGTFLGSERGGDPCAYDTYAQAAEIVALRAEMAKYLEDRRKARGRYW